MKPIKILDKKGNTVDASQHDVDVVSMIHKLEKTAQNIASKDAFRLGVLSGIADLHVRLLKTPKESRTERDAEEMQKIHNVLVELVGFDEDIDKSLGYIQDVLVNEYLEDSGFNVIEAE